MKKLVLLLLASVSLVVFGSHTTFADGIRIEPLQYKSTFKKGEVQRGFVDITNPDSSTIAVKIDVQAFRQIDSKGSLQFYDSEQVRAGIKPEYSEFDLEPYKAIRLYFTADGTKMPPGDVFAAIFATIKNKQTGAAVQQPRVGTLLMFVNGTPGPRNAEITHLAVPFLQIGESVSGDVTVRNPAPKGQATGYFPDMSVTVQPWGGRWAFTGPLVFAANSRTVTFSNKTDLFGLYLLKVQANNAERSQLVFLITGIWRILAPVILVLVIGGAALVMRYKPHRKIRHRTAKATLSHKR